MKKNIIIITIITLLVIVLFPCVALADYQTVSFDGLYYANYQPIGKTTSIDGFVFVVAKADGNAYSMLYTNTWGENNSCIKAPEGAVTVFVRREDNSDFTIDSIFMIGGGFKATGYKDGVLVPEYTKQLDYSVFNETIEFNCTTPINQLRFDTISGNLNLYLDTIRYNTNFVAPTVDINSSLNLDENATSTITSSMLKSSDNLDDASGITYTITDLPDNGHLKKEDNAILLNGTFTQSDIDSGNILYVQDGSNTTLDSFTFMVEDSVRNQLTGQTFNITINAIDDDTPTLSKNIKLTLNEGATKCIDDNCLLADDPDTDNSTLRYTITTAPNHGRIESSDSPGSAISTFTQAQLQASKIQYVHDDSNTTSDSFIFKVADGTPNELTEQNFNIEITAVDDDTPTISTNKKLTLNEGATSCINDSYLLADDPDTDNNTLTFTITSAPNHGRIQNSDSTGSAISTFTQSQLIDGKIQYVHDDSNTTSDSFIFKVADGTPNELTGLKFNIEIVAVDDDAPTITINKRYPDITNDSPLYEGGTCTISKEYLKATDADSDDTTVLFTITHLPNYGVIKNNGVTLFYNGTFTQQDIIDGKIQYVHDGTNTTSDRFEFKVSDGTNELGNQEFYFDITVVDDEPPIISLNEKLILDEGDTSPINCLSAYDPDTNSSTLTFTITTPPSHGHIEASDNPGNVISSFVQAQLYANMIQYVHDGSNATSDSFIFKVSDGAGQQITGQTFNIEITPVDDDAPTISTNKKLTLSEGATSNIDGNCLLADDPDSDNSTLTYTITSAPSNGQVENTDNTGVAITTFTQAQLIDGKIQYVHGGTNTTSDSFIFKVADGAGHELTDQTFSIEITAVDDDAPTISINKGYPDLGDPHSTPLSEGETCCISDEHLEATDTEADDATLIFIVTTLPSNGEIKKDDSTLPLNGTFIQQDIIDGKIQYVHDGSNTTSDSFIFKVSDGSNELTGQTFNLTITAVDDDAPTMVTNNGLPDYPSTSPDLFYTGDTQCISINHLRATDTEANDATLTYTITSTPSNGQIENTDNPGNTITSFTQQNLIDGKIQYVHAGGSSASDSFIFKVSDGSNELTSQTFRIDITVSVSSVTFDNSEVTMNVGVTSALGSTFPHTVSPSNTVNKNTIFTSSNPAVATVNNTTGMVAAIAPGVTKITVISDEKPTVKDECILKVADPTTPPADAKGGTIAGKLIDNIGNPLVGYRVTLCSTPITVITNSLGEFQFPATTFSNHILIVNDPAMHEITRFALGFTQGANTNATIDNTTNTIAITYANRTATINVDLQSNLAGDDIAANNVVFVSNAVAYADVEVSNPETGDGSIPYGGMVMSTILLMVLAGAWVIYKKYNKQEE